MTYVEFKWKLDSGVTLEIHADGKYIAGEVHECGYSSCSEVDGINIDAYSDDGENLVLNIPAKELEQIESHAATMIFEEFSEERSA